MAKRAKSIRPRRHRAVDAFTAIANGFSAMFNRPATSLLAILAVFAFISYQSDANNNIITTVAKHLQNNVSLKPFGDWIMLHKQQVLGFLIYLPAAVFQRSSALYIVVAMALSLYVPEASPWEYVIQAICFFIFTAVRNRQAKVIAMVTVIVCYFAGFGFANIIGKPKSSA